MSDDRQPDHAALLKRSLLAIDQLEKRLAAQERARTEPIAIVGIGCRFPNGADDPAAFWELLRQGVDAVIEVPKERWDVDAIYDPDPDVPGKSYTRWGTFVRDVDRFDPAFFGVSPREAVSMDPQQRLLLEVTWEALENAAIAPASLAGSQTAVYVGITTHDYAMQLAEAVGSRNGDAYTPSGTAHSVAAGRLSYVLGLHGPNVAIDTACSSSLVALHWALHSLRVRECDLALAGGVNLTLVPDGSVLTSRARMMSFDGHCKTFDASADGYVRGEGCGMLVLKRLSDAQHDGDRILALVRGSALNQDGRSSGLTAPNGIAQEAVIRAALANARLQPGEVGYVEAHGTGTTLGDPIEIKALNQVYGQQRPAGQPLQVGSVKTNIGHLEAAAGIAGVIKTVLALQHEAIPPHLHLKQPNPLIDWAHAAIRVPTALTPWPATPGAPRRAGISSFGFSGTNAHVILEEAPAAAPVPAAPPGPQPLVLSAQTPAALAVLAARLEAMLGQADAPALAEVAATLALGRSALVERAALVAHDGAEARRQLAQLAAGTVPPGAARARTAGGSPPEVVFLFTGQGAQYPGMARGLYDTQPVFRAAMDECARGLEGELPRPMLEVVFGSDAQPLDDTAYTQPALFAVEYALAALWRHWGVEPTAVMGHSVGEYVAACVAGVFTLPDALRLIAARGRLMSRQPRDGGMAAVFTDEAKVRAALAGHEDWVSVAATNGPSNTVIAGRLDALDAVLARLAATGVEAQRLQVSHAFHSPLMAPMLDEFERLVAATPMARPRIDVVSNVSGRLADEALTEPGYWRRHVREAVRFAESLVTLQDDGYRVFLEVGPAPTLVGMAQRGSAREGSSWIGSLRKGRDDTLAMLEALAQLQVRGQPVNWRAVLGEDAHRRRVVLPSYPFQRESYWQDLGTRRSATTLARTASGHPLLGGAVPSPLPIFEAEIGMSLQPWLRDHRIFDFTLFPGTGFLELALAAGREALGTPDVEVRGLELREAMALPDAATLRTQVIVMPGPDGSRQVQVHSRPADDAQAPWRLHAQCSVAVAVASAAGAAAQPAADAAMEAVDVDGYYERLAHQGAHYGPAFRGLTQIRRSVADGRGQVRGHVALPAAAATTAASLLLHPALLDACFQLVGAGLDWGGGDAASDDLCVPVSMGSYRLHHGGTSSAWCDAQVVRDTDDADLFRADLRLSDDAGQPLAELNGLGLRRTTRAALERVIGGGATPDWLFDTTWPAQPLAVPESASAAGTWLLAGDDGTLAEPLAQRLRAAGGRVLQVDAGTLDDAQAWRSALAAAASGPEDRLAGVVLLPTAAEAGVDDDIARLEVAQRQQLARALGLVQALADQPARLWVVTRGSQAVAGSVPALLPAPLWGLAGVAAAELPALRTVRVDLEREPREDDAARLADELLAPDGEERVALRAGQRHVARLTPSQAQPRLPEAPLRLEITQRGTLENLKLLPVAREAPGPGQVEIRVHATGLNFRDVLNALGMYPGDPGPLGNECAGVVTAVGEGVSEFAIGDEVVAMVDRSFATWVVAPVALTVRKPAAMSFAEAATVPVTFLTAQYALRDLSRIKKGDRVLIHAVTGGVGMAALQLALRAGATVFGTAGTPAKRVLARRLGAHHVADSRSLSFAADVRAATGGEGVDIVLNSLAGDFITKSLALLRPGGHFVEIGKTGIWDAERVAQAYPGVHYHPLYLGEVAAAQPLFVRGMLDEILRDIGRGELRALPLRTWPLEEAEQAFRFMGQGHHTGKIVITQSPPPAVRPDACYLVTGGLGGLGLACAGWLADAGARHLVLMGRSAPGEAAQAAIAGWHERGVTVDVLACDVADGAALATALQPLAHDPAAPLRGILHAAGTVDDGMLAELDIDRFDRVMAPKVRGTWHLDRLARTLPMDFFVCFSSGAALMGSPGQGNYAAANTFMDALAHVRRAGGHHALSINWGSWSGAGMAADVDASHRRRWAAQGLAMIEPAEGTRMLAQLLAANRHTQAAAIPLVRSRLPAGLGPFYALLQPARAAQALAEAPVVATTELLPRLRAAAPDEAQALLRAFLSEQVVKVLALGNAQEVDTQRSLLDLGMDSLMAMELRNRVQVATEVRLAAADLLKGPSIDSLAADLVGKLGVASAGTVALAPVPADEAWEEGAL